MAKSKKHSQKTLEGIIATTRRGLGFLSYEGEPKRIRIGYDDLNTALNGDRVRIRIEKRNGELYGYVEEILDRAKNKFVGTLDKEGNMFFVVPDDNRMYIDISVPYSKDAKVGDKVYVQMDEWKNEEENPTGKITKVLGKRGNHEVEIQAIVLERGIDTDFPTAVRDEAKKIRTAWYEGGLKESAEQEIAGGTRRDFRSVKTFTIDPADAKDFDDGISMQKLPNGNMEIGIHIADVSHFVLPNSVLDQEAEQRGFSVYLVDRTIPMLPEDLSNDLCSLVPQTERLTFSAVFELDTEANVKNKWFGKGMIYSDKRFSYEEAQEVILDNTNIKTHSKELKTLNGLAKKLSAWRFAKGSIDFDQDEIQVEIDKHGTPTRIYRKERLDTHKLVEEFMLLANRQVALRIFEAHGKKDVERAFLYRVHDLPDKERIEQLSALLRALGYKFHVSDEGVSAHEINTLFKQIEGEPIEGLVKTAMIRSMSKAVYDTKNIGHFGLGFGFYTHFTSPIRRYSDLIVHRLLQSHLSGAHINEHEFGRYKELAKSLSDIEVSIQGAERASTKYKQVEYMARHVGEEFGGIITGVTKWGIYIQDLETGSEGLVHVREIVGDHYSLDDSGYRLIGNRTKKTYSLGDKVKFKVMKANIDERTLDFGLVE